MPLNNSLEEISIDMSSEGGHEVACRWKWLLGCMSERLREKVFFVFKSVLRAVCVDGWGEDKYLWREK